MRKLATAAAVSLVLATGGVKALGLGDIEMRSALNQPMDAEIRLTSVRPGETDGMLVQLASPDAFVRAGIERSAVLTDLDFVVEQGDNGPFIRITSNRAIQEPFLNFLLEVDWPQGRMVREYTVLLDPPVFMTPNATARNESGDVPVQIQQSDNSLSAPAPIPRETADALAVEPRAADAPSAESAVPATASGETPTSTGDVVALTGSADSNPAASARLDAAEITRRQQASDGAALPDVEIVGGPREVPDEFVAREALDLEPTAPRVSNESAGNGALAQADIVTLEQPADAGAPAAATLTPVEEVTVQRGDTLFEIARRTRIPAVSTQQMMLALLNANESAFINRNINLVKAGSVLRVPAASEQAALTQAQAMAEISRQDDLWREYRDSLRGGSGTRIATAPTSTEGLAGSGSDPGTSLSSEAQAIIDEARQELADRNELQIVADNTPTSTAASATADETAAGETDRLGDINRELRLAREELASTRLEGDDLTEAQAELLSTSENLDALVSLRQNEVAVLEAQLAEARALAEAEASAEAEAEALAQAESVAAVGTEAGDGVDAATNAATDTETGAPASDATNTAPADIDAALDLAARELADAAAAGGTAADNAVAEDLTGDGGEALAAATRDTINVDPLAESTEAVIDRGNALTDAGEQLGEVELIDDQATTAANEQAGAVTGPARQPVWYEQFLTDQNKMIAAGAGGLAAIGLLAMFLRRRRRDDDFEEVTGVDHIDDDEAIRLQNELEGIDESVSGAGGLADGQAGAADQQAAAAGAAQGAGGVDHNKVLSEADVYIAYGLHGQAEELLGKAIAEEPDNPLYALKLLETLHAQNNVREFTDRAEDFHQRFGGSASEHWPAIASMGADIDPANALYRSGSADTAVSSPAPLSGSAAAASAGAGASAAGSDAIALPASSNDDVIAAFESTLQNEPFDDADATLQAAPPSSFDEAVDETDLMDQSLDPGFAFDESDLEATGDFTQIAGEVVADLPSESSGSAEELNGAVDNALDGGLTEQVSAVSAAGEAAGEKVADAVEDAAGTLDASDPGSIDFPDFDVSAIDSVSESAPAASAPDASSPAADTSFDDLDLSSPIADDLTLDIDRLSDDIDLDTTELLNDDFLSVDDLDLPEFDADKDSLMEAPGGSDADDWDTMMDLAKAYIDMGDKDSASNTLDEILKGGSPEQISEAETLLRKIS